MKFGIGQPVPRTEDPRFLKGVGRYVGDILPANLAHGFVLRSPHAHARIKSIDTAAAKRAPGVLAVLTGADARADKLGVAALHARRRSRSAVRPRRSWRCIRCCRTTACASSAIRSPSWSPRRCNQARDAAELIRVDYEVLPAIVATGEAAQAGRAAGLGRRAEQHLVRHGARRQGRDRRRLRQRRACGVAEDRQQPAVRQLAWRAAPRSPNTIRPAASTTLHTSHAAAAQGARRSGRRGVPRAGDEVPRGLAGRRRRLRHEGRRVPRGRAGDLGGAQDRPAGEMGRERSESIMSDSHGRDSVSEASLALDKDGKFIGLRVDTDYCQGAYLTPSAGVPAGMGSMALHQRLRHPGGAHHAARRLHQHHADRPLSRRRQAGGDLRDGAAGRQGRRRDEDRPDRDPPAQLHPAGRGAVQDAARAGARQRQLRGGDGHGGRRPPTGRATPSARAESKKRGKLRGRGVAYFMEICGPFNDRMELRFDENGSVTVVAGTHSHGQGHETVYAQMVSEWLGVDFHTVRMIQGDTDAVGFGRGTYGSRSMTIGGSALRNAADVLIEKAKKMAGHVLEASRRRHRSSPTASSPWSAPTSRSRWSISCASSLRAGRLAGRVRRRPRGGRHLHADALELRQRLPHLRGRGRSRHRRRRDRALHRRRRFRRHHQSAAVRGPDPRRPRHGHRPGAAGARRVRRRHPASCCPARSWTTACRAPSTSPSFEMHDLPDRCRSNPIGVKGAGESGTVGAPPTVINAIVDALRDRGVHRRADAGDAAAGLAGDAASQSALTGTQPSGFELAHVARQTWARPSDQRSTRSRFWVMRAIMRRKRSSSAGSMPTAP